MGVNITILAVGIPGGGEGNKIGWDAEVNTFADLPDPTTVPGQLYRVKTKTGSLITFNLRRAGLYESEGGSWKEKPEIKFMFVDDELTFQDDVDNTKQIGFQISAVAAGFRRIFTWPNKDGTVAMLSDIIPTPVASVFGRVGAVVALLNDYTSNLIGNDSGVTGATVTAALDDLDSRIPTTAEHFTSFPGNGTIVGSNSSTDINFPIPFDFDSLISAELIIEPGGAAGINKDIDLSADYGAVGEPVNENSETDITTLYDLGTSGNREAYSIASVLSAIGAGDYVDLEIDHMGIGGAVIYKQVKLVYNKQ